MNNYKFTSIDSSLLNLQLYGIYKGEALGANDSANSPFKPISFNFDTIVNEPISFDLVDISVPDFNLPPANIINDWGNNFKFLKLKVTKIL